MVYTIIIDDHGQTRRVPPRKESEGQRCRGPNSEGGMIMILVLLIILTIRNMIMMVVVVLLLLIIIIIIVMIISFGRGDDTVGNPHRAQIL